MDNQQERLDAIDYARLAMLLDTEGSISMRVLQRSRDRAGNMAPIVTIVNTNMILMNWAHDALTRFHVPHFVQDIKVYVSAKMRLPQRRITITGMKRMQKLLAIIQPYLIAKGKQGELLTEYMNSRQSKWKGMPYTPRELTIANEVRALNSNKGGNFRPVSSESIRAARELQDRLDGMMCSDLTRDRESAAEMPAPVQK